MNESISVESLEHAAELLSQADALIVAAGAGMGVDSGLPDFRGKQGFWNAYPALGREGVDFYRIACPGAFRSQPARAWGFYGHRLKLYRDTQPHPGFQMLKRWGEMMPNGYAVFTSNVDGQFQKAGYPEGTMHECHGSIHHLQCLAPCADAIWEATDVDPVVDEDDCLLLSAMPTCPRCGGLARPNVLMFDDFEWLDNRQIVQASRMDNWLSRVSRPVVVEIGAGSAIPSVRHFSQGVMHQHGGRLIRINLRESQVPTALDVGFAAGAVSALMAIDQIVQRTWPGNRPAYGVET